MLRDNFDPYMAYLYARYGRMSDEVQNPRSPDQQFETIELTRKRMGYPWVHVRDFRDDAISGRFIKKRKGFQDMLRAIRTGMLKVDLILLDTFERFGRADELAETRRELYNKHGVLILTADSNFANPTSVSGRALALVEQIRSTEDSRVKAHNVLRGKRDLILQKKAWPGGAPPFGYKLKSTMTTGKNGEEVVDYKVLERDPTTNWIVERLFHAARDTGWGTMRLTRLLNADSTIQDSVKPFSEATIGYILGNEIYYGELLWGQHSTGIVNDTFVKQRNDEEDILRVPDFCQPTVSRELWDEVDHLRRKRQEEILHRRSGATGNGKLIKPLTPGLTLKHLLTGLVRCGHCNASMRPSPTKCTYKSGKTWERLYYSCPNARGGSCPNHFYVREQPLREAVIARIRSRLFPLPDCTGNVPEWFGPLVETIRHELRRRAEEQPDQRPGWELEKDELEERVCGWSMSLANPRLDPILRADIEQEYGKAKARIVELGSLLETTRAQCSHLETVLDSQQVLGRLNRLDDVLASNNPTCGNLELSLHLDRIDCFEDGKVVLRTCKLGIFEGAVELLRGGAEVEITHDEAARPPRVNPRSRPPHRVLDEPSKVDAHVPDVSKVNDPRRFSELESCWFWQDDLEMPRTLCWAEANAAAVAELRKAGWTIERLARHFEKSPPTIRHALKVAAATDASLGQLPRRMPRPNWAKDNAAEVARLKAAGMSTLELAEHFHKSDTYIRTALKYAQELSTPQAEENAPSGNDNMDGGDAVPSI